MRLFQIFAWSCDSQQTGGAKTEPKITETGKVIVFVDFSSIGRKFSLGQTEDGFAELRTVGLKQVKNVWSLPFSARLSTHKHCRRLGRRKTHLLEVFQPAQLEPYCVRTEQNE